MFGLFNRADTNVVASLIAEKAINAELRAMLAGERARFDWLAATVNELRIERAMLYEKLGFHVPVATIERTAPASALPGADDNYVPPAGAQLANVGDVIAQARERRDTPPSKDVDRLLNDLARNISFEDVGDEVAEAIGVGHDAAGNLIERPTR